MFYITLFLWSQGFWNKKIQKKTGNYVSHITNITPFDSRVDFGISQQLNVQKIMVPVDGMEDDSFRELILNLAKYLPENENARVHLFTRIADYDRKKVQLFHKNTPNSNYSVCVA